MISDKVVILNTCCSQYIQHQLRSKIKCSHSCCLSLLSTIYENWQCIEYCSHKILFSVYYFDHTFSFKLSHACIGCIAISKNAYNVKYFVIEITYTEYIRNMYSPIFSILYSIIHCNGKLYWNDARSTCKNYCRKF